MPFLRVISPGLLTTIQDRGRYYFQKWGIPVAGAMDEYALRVANILVGNHEGEGCLEITVLGPVIEFLEPGLIALTGADLGARLNDKTCATWASFAVDKGDILRFTGIQSGCRAYLAAAGGFDIPEVMGSKSNYLRGNIGGLNGRALGEGDELNLRPSLKSLNYTGAAVPAQYRYKLSYPQTVRVVLGPQDDAFDDEGISTFLESEYFVSTESDRMGCRLEGPRIVHRKAPDIISDGIAMGSIQVPGNGTPIIMMADRQTTGGYAKIATVITPDLRKIAQAKPGDGIRFTSLTVVQAHEIYLEYENTIKLLSQILI